MHTAKGYSDTSHWSDVTTGEVGSMVREAIKRGEQAMVEEAKLMGQPIGTMSINVTVLQEKKVIY